MKGFDYFGNTKMFLNESDIAVLLKLRRPSLFRIKGKDSNKSLLVSCLLHGCEPCGFRAVLKELNSNYKYPYDWYLFVGNVEAAQIKPYFTNRLVQGGQNYNRIWISGSKSKVELIAKKILKKLEKLNIFAHLDLHSFTAKSTPTHGFVPNKNSMLLGKKLVNNLFYDEMLLGTMVGQTCKFGPSVIIECGTNNSKSADDFAFYILQKFFKEFGMKNGRNKVICRNIYTNMINIKIKPNVKVVWSDKNEDLDLTIRSDIDKFNVKLMHKGDFLGWAKNLDCFILKDKHGISDANDFFVIKKGLILLKKSVVPNLMTANEKISKESGFYFFEP